MENTELVPVDDLISDSGTETFEGTISSDDLMEYVQEFKDMQIGAIAFISFALGVVIGIIVFHILSRRWFA